MNKFLFIIPATPVRFLDESRSYLQNLCIQHLLSQTYSNWVVLWISDTPPPNMSVDEHRFIHLKYDGPKESKLQEATRYIVNENLESDYIIRLDDDDLFNTKILNEIRNDDFDVFVDLHQTFWFYETNCYASSIRYWFANTCVHKTEHALMEYGTIDCDTVQLNTKVSLIENEHHKIHSYYSGKRIKFAAKNNPIYLRTITFNSITFKQRINKNEYFCEFGNWSPRKIDGFLVSSFIKEIPFEQSFINKLNNFKKNIVAKLNYNKIVGI